MTGRGALGEQICKESFQPLSSGILPGLQGRCTHNGQIGRTAQKVHIRLAGNAKTNTNGHIGVLAAAIN